MQTWQDLKSRTKTKSAVIKRSAIETGGGPLKKIKLSNDEDSILQLIKPVCVSGLPDVTESEVLEIEVPTEPPSFSEKRNISYSNRELTQQSENLETCAQSGNVQNNLHLESQSQKIKNSKKKGMTSAAAVQGFEEYQNKKLIAKEKYYSRKLEIMNKMLEVEREKNKNFDRIATALENFKNN